MLNYVNLVLCVMIDDCDCDCCLFIVHETRVLIAQQMGVVCVSVSYRFSDGRGILQVPCLRDSSCCKTCPKSILILFHFSCDYSTSREKLVWLGSLEDGSFKKWHILMIGSFFLLNIIRGIVIR